MFTFYFYNACFHYEKHEKTSLFKGNATQGRDFYRKKQICKNRTE